LHAKILAMEISYIWNWYACMSTEDLAQYLKDIEPLEAELSSLKQSSEADPLLKEFEVSLSLIKGTILNNSGRFGEAIKLVTKAAQEVTSKEKWVWGHAVYELGTMLLTSVAKLPADHKFHKLGSALEAENLGTPFERCSKAKAKYKELLKFRQDFNFEIRLRFKLQAASTHCSKVHRSMKKEQGI